MAGAAAALTGVRHSTVAGELHLDLHLRPKSTHHRRGGGEGAAIPQTAANCKLG